MEYQPIRQDFYRKVIIFLRRDVNILLTGGAGFIGFYLSKKLIEEGHQLTIIDNLSRNKMDEDFRTFIANENVRFIQADLTDKGFYKELDNHYHRIIHLAAINGTKYFYEKPYEVLRVNILSLINLLEWVDESNCEKFLFSSSSEAYAGTIREENSNTSQYIPTKEDIPLTIDDIFNERFSYGGSKLAGELLTINYFKKVRVPFCILRYHNIYGPRMGFEHVIPEFSKRIFLQENPFKIYGGQETRAFCFIGDAVEATYLLSCNENCNDEVFHVGNNLEEISILDLAQMMLDKAESKSPIEIEEAPIGSVSRRCPDISKLCSLTSYTPEINLATGVELTLEWYIKKYKELGI